VQDEVNQDYSEQNEVEVCSLNTLLTHNFHCVKIKTHRLVSM